MTILSEGNNSKHLKRWVELNFPNDVSVFEGLEQFSSDQNLLAYGRLLAKMNTNTHFVVVWDWDAETKANTLKYELPQNAKVTPYAFPQRPDNMIAERGIENNYDESLLEPFLTEEDSHGGMLLRRVFKKSDKDKFADHILRCGTPAALYKLQRSFQYHQWDFRIIGTGSKIGTHHRFRKKNRRGS